MTANLSRLGSVEYNTESTFAASSSTFGTRLLPISPPDVSGLRMKMEMISIMQQRPHEGIANVRTSFDATFSLEFLLTGHGATAAGALTATDLSTLLGYCVGVLNTAGDGGTVDSASSTTVIQGANATLAAGGLCRIGAVADGRGGGQFYPIATVAGTSGATGMDPTLLLATPVAPNLADVLYAVLIVHPSETPGTFETVQSLRFRILTPNEQYDCFGCACESIEFSNLNAGEVPKVKLGFRAARFIDTSSQTFPAAASTNAKVGAPVACGSHVGQVAGVSTRQAFNVRSFGVTIDMQVAALTGPGSDFANQVITSYRRTRCQASIAVTVDAQATGTNVFYDAWQDDEVWQWMATLSAEDGKAGGFYFPRLRFKEPLPVQKDMEGLNRVMVEMEALTNTTTTTDLTLSNWRLGLG